MPCHSRMQTIVRPFMAVQRESRKMIRRLPSFSLRRSGKVGERGALALIAVLGLSACAREPAPQGINDPNEATNRYVHSFNRGVDKALLRPAASAYGKVLPEPVERGVANFASNLDGPGDVINNLLQANPEDAMHNTVRFVINTTIGIGGLFDPATPMGLAGSPTDFGETLHVWGAKEGRYVEVPFLGPSTTRDFTGTLVDVAMNPLRLVFETPETYWMTGAKFASTLGDRSRYSDTVDSILYESADSYAQARLLYLQNRRFELGQADGSADANADANFEDPYAQ